MPPLSVPLLQRNDVWKLPLPELTDLHGKFPLRNDTRIPAHLKETLTKITDAAKNGVGCIVLDLRKRRPMQSGFNGKSDTLNPLTLTEDADVFQLVHRGLNEDDRFRDFGVVSADDRAGGLSDSLDVHDRFVHEVTRDEQTGSKNLFEKKIDRRDISGRYRQKGIIVMTPETDLLFGQGEKREKLKSKLGRLFPDEQYLRIDVPPAPENLYTGWVREACTAQTDNFRTLLIQAACNPLKTASGTYQAEKIPRLAKPLPNGLEFHAHPDQEEAFRKILCVMQAQLWSSIKLLIHGAEYATGKTTLLTAQLHLQNQLGFAPEYTQYSEHPPCVSVRLEQFVDHRFHDQAEYTNLNLHNHERHTMTANRMPKFEKPFITLEEWQSNPPKTYHELQGSQIVVDFPGPAWTKNADF